ncbi:MAG: winged helix-turn-helix transcriptional regulator [Candidatus Methanomethylophilaceae archaeon]|nr:winged helix-turn-helix transcriptional regulator [Candidatus Methanomethylophilaceae archaeon]
MADESVISMLKAVSDPNRLRILDIIGGGEVCACKFLEWMDISQPTLSHHLKVLTESGLIVGRKEKQWIHYSIDKEKLSELNSYLSGITAERTIRIE